ncbi:hypothetical protein SUGI_0015070 [Cryptomeria japonica]|uniref:probable mitochondrial-processing peptidase subunit beta, mitochondrial n=1 Tax=Cryptomeria japonica TaxID=3369 RepID=UPI002408C3D9|nr:probable mitochondrial-processing peptidase subunit beta, mitochondrial [Cryptomeria japonica]GLJ05271.1 hypothetical protein SUGI_0015070 [Cryptomeria japonica]
MASGMIRKLASRALTQSNNISSWKQTQPWERINTNVNSLWKFQARRSLNSPAAAAVLQETQTIEETQLKTLEKTQTLEETQAQILEKVQTLDERFLRYNSPEPRVVDHTEVLSFPATRITTLPNGLRVATESNLNASTATVGVWIDAGSRYETAETNGTAHFLEHMIFKGTAKRPVLALEQEIEDMGGHLNAYTSREQTTYYAKVMKEDVNTALDILADILQNSCFHEKAIRRERKVILREMEEVESQKEEVIFDLLHSAAFFQSPLGRTILGPAENIRTISRKDLHQYISTHYSGPRMVVSAAGAVKHEEIVDQVKRLFTNLSTDPTTVRQLVEREPSVFTGYENRIVDDDLPLAHVAVAFKGASSTNPDSLALMVIQALLGGWRKSAGAGANIGSELARKVAENDLADSITAFNTNFIDTGLFGVYAVAKPDCLEDLSYTIMNEMNRLTQEVSDVDVIRAQNQLKSCMVLHMDGTSSAAEDIGRQLLTYGRRIPLAELFARIDAIDVDTVKRVANQFMSDRDVAISGIGPIQRLPDLSWFRSRTSLGYQN